MANLNSSSSRSRNLLWLSEQQEKLAAANRSRRSPSPNSNQRRPPVLAPKPQLTKPSPPPQPQPPISSLAFSNPIYDEYRGPAEPISDLPSSSSSSAQEPDQQKRTVKSPSPPPPSFPVPKPRKSLANTSSVGVLSPKSPHLNLKPETSNSSTASSSSNTSSSASSIENCIDEQQQQQLLLRQRRLDLTASDSVHSFLYFEQELPAKMTALINEIETLAESLASSGPEEEEEEEKEENETNASDSAPAQAQPSLTVGTFRRKRIQVQKELFKFSFSSGSDMLPSPVSVLSPDDFSGRELADEREVTKFTPTKHNTDSGVFSSGDNEISTVSEVSNVTSSESTVEGGRQKSASIPPSPPPPQLPPRKNHPQYQKEPKAIENLAPPSLIAPSPVPSNYSTSTIPSKPPPPIPKLQRQEKAEEESPPPPPPPQNNLQETLNEQTSSNHNNTSSNDQNITTTTTSAAPKPPQPPATPLTPLLINSEVLAMEHLHTTKLSLQRSGYLWKTGPNFKSFKYRWCILHRQNLDLADASFSYYFNRSSISASLSGKIMVSEMEYVGVCEAAPAKARLPKFEKGRERSVDAASSAVEKRNGEKGGGGSSSVVFLEIGVRCRGGRVFLLAARAPADRQLWLHAFVQALCLHAFKNKELYAFGFLRAKFTVSSGRWASAFALLTADRFLYVFEVEAGSPVRAVHCRTYQAYNLRKTVRIGRLDEAGGAVLQPQQPSSSSSSGAIYENVNECKYGFSVTQNGGRVVYLVADHPEHSARWYRAVLKFWPSPEDPARCTFEEQYLTRENIPVAVDKCLKFLDTYSTVAAKSTLFKAPPLFANIEQVHPLVLANSTRLLGELRANAWAVHLLPAVHSAQQVSLLLLLYLRSLAQCILTEVMLPAWMKLAEKLEKVEKDEDEDEGGDEEPEVSGVEGDEHVDVLEAVKSRLQALPPIHYATLRRVILCLANVNMQYPLSTSLCKALVFSKGQQQQKLTTPTSAKAPVSLSSARTLITAFIKHHLYLFEVTKEEVDREMHIKRVVHLIINQRTEECLQAQQQQMMMAGMAESGSQNSSSYPTNISKPVLPKTVVVPSSSLSACGGGGLPLTLVDTKQVSSLIIAIKVNLDDGGVLGGGGGGGGKSNGSKPSVVNVHLNKETTAADVLDMVLEKSDLKEADRGEYALFEVLCYRRLERLVRRAEPVLPIVLSWSSWRQSNWCAEAGLEVRHGDSLMRGGSLALLHNREKYQHLLSSSSSSSSASAEVSTGVTKGGPGGGGGGGGRLLVTTSHHLVSKRTSQSMKVRPTAAAGALNQKSPSITTNSNQMLMSVIRYCGQSDTRLAGSILAEFSSGCLFLYCKASHQLVGQHSVEDIFWYVGVESASLVAAQQGGSPSSSAEDHSKKGSQQNVNSSSSVKQGSLMAVGNGATGDQLNVPALTIVDRRLLTVAQSKDRLNFGQTLLFTSWNELYQWMRALMAAGEKVNAGSGGGRR